MHTNKWYRNQSGYQQVLAEDPNITRKLNLTIPTAFLIHGWFDSVNRTWINKTMSSYVRHFHSNICGVDWSRLALTEYTIAADNTKIVAKYLQKFIEFLMENGMKLKQITLIGHSMGAQIAGMTGGKFNGSISEIIGMLSSTCGNFFFRANEQIYLFQNFNNNFYDFFFDELH